VNDWAADAAVSRDVGASLSSCRRSPVMQECQSSVSRVSVSMQPELTRWSRCFATWRTHTPDFSWLSLFCPAKHPSMVNISQWVTVHLYWGIFVWVSSSTSLMSSQQRQYAEGRWSPAAWNSLSDNLHNPALSTNSFRCLLKTRLFSEYYYLKCIGGILHYALYKFTTYLQTYVVI